MLKAVAGGGGRGMRAVRDAAELPAAYARCTAEARAAFDKQKEIEYSITAISGKDLTVTKENVRHYLVSVRCLRVSIRSMVLSTFIFS